MKDIPFFATEHGVVALFLQQIPYTGTAYITIQFSQNIEELLQECISFCRAVGAESIYATGHDALARFPVFTRIVTMQMSASKNGEGACLFPATEETILSWIEIYNEAMRQVPCATIISKENGKSFMEKRVAYFVHEHGELLGIGAVDDDMVQAVVSCRKGSGERVMNTLCSAVIGDTVKLEVADNNLPAIKLYSRMGFIATGVHKIWYDVNNFTMSSKNT